MDAWIGKGGGTGLDVNTGKALFLEQGKADEINKIPEKTTTTDNDVILIEDSEDGYKKKRVLAKNLKGKTGIDNAELWKQNTEYKADDVFHFSTSNTTAKWANGTDITPDSIYFAKYLVDTTSANSLTNAEMAKFEVVSDGEKIDSSNFKAVGDENSIGINKDDNTLQKVINKVEDFKVTVPKAFEKVTLATDANLTALQALEPTTTENDLLFEFKASDGTKSYIVTPLDSFIDLKAIKKIEYKTLDANETILKITTIEGVESDLDLKRFVTKVLLLADVEDKTSKKEGSITGELLFKALEKHILKAQLGEIFVGTDETPKLHSPKNLKEEITLSENTNCLTKWNDEATWYGSDTAMDRVRFVLGNNGIVYEALKSLIPANTPITDEAHWKAVTKKPTLPLYFANFADANATKIQPNQIYIIGANSKAEYKGAWHYKGTAEVDFDVNHADVEQFGFPVQLLKHSDINTLTAENSCEVIDSTLALGEDAETVAFMLATKVKITGGASWANYALPAGKRLVKMYVETDQPQMTIAFLNDDAEYSARVYDIANNALLPSTVAVPDDKDASITLVKAKTVAGNKHYIEFIVENAKGGKLRFGHYTLDLTGVTVPCYYDIAFRDKAFIEPKISKETRFFDDIIDAEAETIEKNQLFVIGAETRNFYVGTYMNMGEPKKFSIIDPTKEIVQLVKGKSTLGKEFIVVDKIITKPYPVEPSSTNGLDVTENKILDSDGTSFSERTHNYRDGMLVSVKEGDLEYRYVKATDTFIKINNSTNSTPLSVELPITDNTIVHNAWSLNDVGIDLTTERGYLMIGSRTPNGTFLQPLRIELPIIMGKEHKGGNNAGGGTSGWQIRARVIAPTIIEIAGSFDVNTSHTSTLEYIKHYKEQREVVDPNLVEVASCFYLKHRATRGEAKIQFTPTRNMTVKVNWESSGWRGNWGEGRLTTTMQGAIEISARVGYTGLMFSTANQHQALVGDTGIYELTAGREVTFSFINSNAEAIYVDANDPCSVELLEIGKTVWQTVDMSAYMLKSDYDKNNNKIVDDAENITGDELTQAEVDNAYDNA